MEDFGKIIDGIKKHLSASESLSRNSAISNLLEALRKNNGEQFVMQLVHNGIISDLIAKTRQTNRRDLLECIEIMSETNAFYTSDIVDETIAGITMHRLINTTEESAIAVNIILTIVTKVFVDFTESQGTLLIKKHEKGLLSLIERAFFDSLSMLSATKLLNFVIKYGTKDFKVNHISNIKLVYTSAIKFLKAAEGISDLEKLQVVCRTSISLSNFCKQLDENELDGILTGSSETSSLYQIPEIKKDFIESIRKIAIKYLIPLAKRLEIEIETADTLIEFLETVIKLRAIKDKLLCAELVKEGYLKYLLKLSLLKPNGREKVCILIAEIIVTLKEAFDLPIDDWRGGSIAFHDFLSTGLVSLPIEPSQWGDLLKTYTSQSNSLLVLLFCHFIGTEEKYIFTQESLAVKLTSVEEECTEPIFLKALWLLYSVATLASKELNSDRHLYTKATKSLAASLEKQGKIDLTYTHNADLLLYSIKETNFPKKLRIKIITHWLESSDSNMEFDIFIQECLVQSYDELKVVKLLMTIIHENNLKNPNKPLNAYESLLRFKSIIPKEVVEFVWKTLAEDLACYSYTPINSNILKSVLKITGTLSTSESVSVDIIRKCAKGICKVLIREDTDVILKMFLVTAAAFAIRQSVQLNDSEVAEIFLKDDKFLNAVYASGFSLQKPDLTEMCFRTLTCLIDCQIRYNLQWKTVSQLTFEELADLLMSLKEEVTTAMFVIEFVKFLLRNKVENPVIGLRRLENNSDLVHIYNVYLLIHIIHSEIVPGEEDQIYQCLKQILNYSFDQKLNVNVFFSCASTALLVELAITGFPAVNSISYYFLDFATTWLGYLKNYRSQNEIRIHGLPEKSAELLVQFLPIVMSLNDTHCAVHNFITAVSDYMKRSK